MGLTWGLNWPAVKTLLTEIPPVTIRAVALSAASLILGMIVLALRKSLVPRRDELAGIVRTGLLTVFGFNVLVTFGQQMTETATATIIAYTMPGSDSGSGDADPARADGGAPLGGCSTGNGRHTGPWRAEDLDGLLAAPLGPACVLASALSWALGNVSSKSRQWSLEPMALAVWYLGVSALTCWPLVFIFEPLAGQSLPSMKVSLVLAGGTSWAQWWFCYALYAFLIRELPAGIAALATLLAPVVGVTSSFVLLDDPATTNKIIGAAFDRGVDRDDVFAVRAKANDGAGCISAISRSTIAAKSDR